MSKNVQEMRLECDDERGVRQMEGGDRNASASEVDDIVRACLNEKGLAGACTTERHGGECLRTSTEHENGIHFMKKKKDEAAIM